MSWVLDEADLLQIKFSSVRPEPVEGLIERSFFNISSKYSTIFSMLIIYEFFYKLIRQKSFYIRPLSIL